MEVFGAPLEGVSGYSTYAELRNMLFGLVRKLTFGHSSLYNFIEYYVSRSIH